MFGITKPFIYIKIPYCEHNGSKSKHFLKKFHKFTNNGFRVAVTWKTRNIPSLFSLKRKKVINRVLHIREIVLGVHVTLVNASVMQKFSGMNIIIWLKVQNNRNTFEAISTTALHGLLLQMLQKCWDKDELRDIINCSMETWS